MRDRRRGLSGNGWRARRSLRAIRYGYVSDDLIRRKFDAAAFDPRKPDIRSIAVGAGRLDEDPLARWCG